jgi:hypothetical protein
VAFVGWVGPSKASGAPSPCPGSYTLISVNPDDPAQVNADQNGDESICAANKKGSKNPYRDNRSTGKKGGKKK